MPHVVVSPLAGTYLAWYDFSYYIEEKDIKNFYQEKCNLAVDYGIWFGETGKVHVRINLATERKIVEGAMNNIIRSLRGGVRMNYIQARCLMCGKVEDVGEDHQDYSKLCLLYTSPSPRDS